MIVKPVLNKLRPFNEVFNETNCVAGGGSGGYDDDEKPLYRRQSNEHGRNIDYRGDPLNYRENLTDKQKYRESLAEKRINQIKYQEREQQQQQQHHQRKSYRDESPVERSPKYRDGSMERSTKYREVIEQQPQQVVVPLQQQPYPSNVKQQSSKEYREKSVERSSIPIQSIKESIIPYRGRQSSSGGGGGGGAGGYDHGSPPTTTTNSSSAERNPYKEPESKPYRESIEKMLKSPVMRYKSFDDSTRYEEKPTTERIRYSSSSNDRTRDKSPEQLTSRYHQHHNKEPVSRYRDDHHHHQRYQMEEQQQQQSLSRPSQQQQQQPQRRRQPEDRQNLAPEMIKISSKDRFQDAKEKFQAMERERLRIAEQNKLIRKNSLEPIGRRGSLESPITPIRQYSEQNSRDGWSSDEEPLPRTTAVVNQSRYREIPTIDRYPGLDRHEHVHSHHQQQPQPSSRSIAPSKSLGNLVKGYRHSYAEPQIPASVAVQMQSRNNNPLPRGSGRVGLAAVNPY